MLSAGRALIVALAALCFGAALEPGAVRAEGMDRLVFLGHSVQKTMEFSYYLDACGNPAGGAHLRQLALRRLRACQAEPGNAGLRTEVEALSRQMSQRLHECDADRDCVRGRQEFCPRVVEFDEELGLMMHEADDSKVALNRLIGGCN